MLEQSDKKLNRGGFLKRTWGKNLTILMWGIWNIETKMHGNDSSKHTQMLIYSLFSCFDFRDCRLLAGTLVRKCTVGSRTKIYIIKLHVKFTN